MSADLEQMAFIGELPWHWLGTRLEPGATTELMLKESGLNWLAIEAPLYTWFNDKGYVKIEGYKGIVRDTDIKAITSQSKSIMPMGVLGDEYGLLQNVKAFEIFDPLVKEGLINYETAGVLTNSKGKGSKVWVLAKVNTEDLQVTDQIGDKLKPYLLFSNSFDGSLSLRIQNTSIRVVCSNTMYAAIQEKGCDRISIRHGKHIEANFLKRGKAFFDGVLASMHQTVQHYQKMESTPLKQVDFVKYLDNCFAISTETKSVTDWRAYDVLNTEFDTHRNNNGDCSVYGAYNAITYWLSHIRGREESSRLYSNAFGSNNLDNRKAYLEACKLSNIDLSDLEILEV